VIAGPQTRPGPARATRRLRRLGYIVAAVLVILVIADFTAKAVAQDVMADKIQQQGLPHKPGVSIAGFPFLTQVAAKNLGQVGIRATDVPAGPVTISQVNATARGIRLDSYAFRRGMITSLSGTAVISFTSLANALAQQVGPLGSLLNGAGLDLTYAGPGEVKASLSLVVVSGSATWRVTRVTGNELRISLVGSSGLPSSLLGSIRQINLHLPSLPLHLTIDSITVSTAGVVGHVSGRDVPFGS
jgi:LmeA-like phospholipid-binding